GGRQTGSAPERAMLTVILDGLVNETPSDRRTTRLLMQATVSTLGRLTASVDRLRAELRGEPDPRIASSFCCMVAFAGTLGAFLELRGEARGKSRLSDGLRHRAANLSARLRESPAKAGVDALVPDLIIHDEFQRFRSLLDHESGE